MRQKRSVEGTARLAVAMAQWAVVMCAAMVLCAAGSARAAEAQSAKEGKTAQAATVEPDPTKNYTEEAGGTKMEMIWIPGGTFQMGSRITAEEVVKKFGGVAGDEMYFQDERPLHTVELEGFWMGKFEVTNAQFRKFRSGHSSGKWEDHDLNGDKQPVVMVSWDDARAFCDWLSDLSDKSYTLPTEAQWEHACRAGTETERYWGDDDETMGRYANVCDQTAQEALKKFQEENNMQWKDWMAAKTKDGNVVSAPVGSLLPNKLGLHDMIGNVWEWCADWYGVTYYADSPRANPTGPASGEHRMLRGGSWFHVPRYCRSSSRLSAFPEVQESRFGFRVARIHK